MPEDATEEEIRDLADSASSQLLEFFKMDHKIKSDSKPSINKLTTLKYESFLEFFTWSKSKKILGTQTLLAECITSISMLVIAFKLLLSFKIPTSFDDLLSFLALTLLPWVFALILSGKSLLKILSL